VADVCLWTFSISASVTPVESFRLTLVNTSKTGWTHDACRDVMVAVDTACACDVRLWQSRDTTSLAV